MNPSSPTHVALFEYKEIRRLWHEEQWFFSVLDVVKILTDSADPKQYIKKMRARDAELSGKWGTICTLLDIVSKDGKKRKETMAGLEGIFRIIQSIPSPKAEPFKAWLAQVGQERVMEIQDPELAMDRAKEIYEKKGYPTDWIAKRMRGINVLHTLTEQWKERGAREGLEFAILTDEIYKGTFEVSAQQYKQLKALEKPDNLRDHMTELELILTMLGEASTTEISKKRDTKGFTKLKTDAHDGGNVAGNARKEIESKTKQSVLSKRNFLPEKIVKKPLISRKRKAK